MLERQHHPSHCNLLLPSWEADLAFSSPSLSSSEHPLLNCCHQTPVCSSKQHSHPMWLVPSSYHCSVWPAAPVWCDILVCKLYPPLVNAPGPQRTWAGAALHGEQGRADVRAKISLPSLLLSERLLARSSITLHFYSWNIRRISLHLLKLPLFTFFSTSRYIMWPSSTSSSQILKAWCGYEGCFADFTFNTCYVTLFRSPHSALGWNRKVDS